MGHPFKHLLGIGVIRCRNLSDDALMVRTRACNPVQLFSRDFLKMYSRITGELDCIRDALFTPTFCNKNLLDSS